MALHHVILFSQTPSWQIWVGGVIPAAVTSRIIVGFFFFAYLPSLWLYSFQTQCQQWNIITLFREFFSRRWPEPHVTIGPRTLIVAAYCTWWNRNVIWLHVRHLKGFRAVYQRWTAQTSNPCGVDLLTKRSDILPAARWLFSSPSMRLEQTNLPTGAHGMRVGVRTADCLPVWLSLILFCISPLVRATHCCRRVHV